MSGVVGQKLGRKVSRAGPRVSSEQVLGQLRPGVAPGEVGVRLGEPELAQLGHHLGAREGLGEEDEVGVLPTGLGDEPLPEPERLGVRVVDAEDAHPEAGPVQHHAQQRLPELAPVRGIELQGVDVLVLLGRVLRVLDGPVGPATEPLRVFPHPRMIRRALEGEVERELEAVLLPGGHQGPEVLLRPQLRVDRGVPALGGPDGPRAAEVAGLRGAGVVPTLAEGPADGVDGGQVQHVEAHRGDGGDPRHHVAQGAVAGRVGGGRAREELVPGAVAGPLPVHVHPQLTAQGGGVAAIRVADRQRPQLLVEGEPGPRLEGLAPGQALGGGEERGRRVAPGTGRGALQQPGADLQVDRLHGAGRHLLRQAVAPAREVVHPGLDGIAVGLERGDVEGGAPPVVPQGRHRHLGPAGVARGAVAEHGRQHVVPLGEDVRLDHQPLADRPLHREPATVHLR